MMRAGVLSDPKVIAEINRNYIPLDLDVSRGKMPSELLPALEPLVERAKSTDYYNGLATAVVVDPDGRFVLACSGCGHNWEREISVNYNAGRFLKFLQNGVDRYARVQAIEKMDGAQREAATKSLVAELYQTVMAEAQCHRPGSPELANPQ